VEHFLFGGIWLNETHIPVIAWISVYVQFIVCVKNLAACHVWKLKSLCCCRHQLIVTGWQTNSLQ